MKAAADCDAILLSDYGTGLVTPALAAALGKRVAARTRRRPVPILVDSRYNLLRYRGLTACTPNESEVEQLLDVRIGDNIRALERAGRALLKRTRMQAVLITRGSRGMALFEAGRPTVHVPICGGHGHRHDDAGDGGRWIVLRRRAPGELRRRPGRDEAGHRHRVPGRAAGRCPERSLRADGKLVAGRSGPGAEKELGN
jgi:hypothetical protein